MKSLLISGKECLPLIEGGKGIAVSTGLSAGAWAAAGGAGTFSGVYGDFYDEDGKLVPLIFNGKTRKERSLELTNHAIKAAISQARIAYDASKGLGAIHMNVLWGMASVERLLVEVLDKTKGVINGITGGAGLPFKMGEIAAKYKVFYYPIVSSFRTFNILWKKSFQHYREWLGGVVYEDPWKAGGHNGISNSEDPNIPEDPYQRVVAIRKSMNEFGLQDIPIIMAGGVWFLTDWKDWIDNKEVGPIAFQFGTRPLLTVESGIPNSWKQKLLTLKKDDISSNHFSPTGFYSLAVNNDFINELRSRAERQINYSSEYTEIYNTPFAVNARTNVYIKEDDLEKVANWMESGFNQMIRTPDTTIIFVDDNKADQIKSDIQNCAGCLAYCRFSNWSEYEALSQDKSPDPRTYCIRKTLDDIVHGGDVENNLMFAGTQAYMFAQDPFYANGFIPTVKQLMDRIVTGH